MQRALVCGAGGFIGSHLVKRLKRAGFWVRGVDMKYPEFADTAADDFAIGDLRDRGFCRDMVICPARCGRSSGTPASTSPRSGWIAASTRHSPEPVRTAASSGAARPIRKASSSRLPGSDGWNTPFAP